MVQKGFDDHMHITRSHSLFATPRRSVDWYITTQIYMVSLLLVVIPSLSLTCEYNNVVLYRVYPHIEHITCIGISG